MQHFPRQAVPGWRCPFVCLALPCPTSSLSRSGSSDRRASARFCPVLLIPPTPPQHHFPVRDRLLHVQTVCRREEAGHSDHEYSYLIFLSKKKKPLSTGRNVTDKINVSGLWSWVFGLGLPHHPSHSRTHLATARPPSQPNSKPPLTMKPFFFPSPRAGFFPPRKRARMVSCRVVSCRAVSYPPAPQTLTAERSARQRRAEHQTPRVLGACRQATCAVGV